MENKDTKQLECGNCGAKIYELDAKCPFCGHINYLGAEHEFMENMYRTEANLDKITEAQVDDIKKEVKKNTRIIAIIGGIVLVIVLIIVGFIKLSDLFWSYSFSEVDAKEQMIWQMKKFPQLDEWYEAGEYDKILQFQRDLYLSEEESQYSLYNWDHYDFLTAYEKYVGLLEYETMLDEGKEISDFDAKYMLYYGMWYYYEHYETGYEMFSEHDIQLISTIYRDKAEEVLFERMKFTKEELDELHRKCVSEDGKYLEWKACKKYAKKLHTRFE